MPGVRNRATFWWRAVQQGAGQLNSLAGWVGLVVLVLGTAVGVAVPQVYHVSHWLTAVVLLGLLVLVLAEGAYRIWRQTADREQELKTTVSQWEHDLQDTASREEKDKQAAVAEEELRQVRVFHEVAYDLLTQLRTASLIGARPTADITDDLKRAIGTAQQVLRCWDTSLGWVTERELLEALNKVQQIVLTEVLPALANQELPDRTSLRQGLRNYRQVANRLIGARLGPA
jgi:hypothetical protein